MTFAWNVQNGKVLANKKAALMAAFLPTEPPYYLAHSGILLSLECLLIQSLLKLLFFLAFSIKPSTKGLPRFRAVAGQLGDLRRHEGLRGTDQL